MPDLDLPKVAALLDIAEKLHEYGLTEHVNLRMKVQEELAKLDASLKPKEKEETAKEPDDEPPQRASIRGR